MPTKVHKLKVTDSPFALLAISCSHNRLKLAWLLNDALSLDIQEVDPIQLDSGLQFPAQGDSTSFPERSYLLVKNRYESRYLIKELQNVDYILKIEGEIDPLQVKATINTIRGLKGIVAVIEVNPKGIKGIKNLP